MLNKSQQVILFSSYSVVKAGTMCLGGKYCTIFSNVVIFLCQSF